MLVLEREPRLGAHQTSHNSGVIHQGIYYAPGSLKARLCREGADALYEYCAGNGIAGRGAAGRSSWRCATPTCRAWTSSSAGRAQNGVPGLRAARPGRAARGRARGRPASPALHSPQTGIVDFAAVAAAYARDVEAHGGEIRTRRRRARGDRPRRTASRSSLGDGAASCARARAVTCGGAWSDLLALASGAAVDVRIVPFRGAYLKLRADRTQLVRGQIYPVPDPSLPFLGVHLSRTIGGDVLLGPTALLAGARDAYRLARVRRADLGATLRWPGTRQARAPLVADRRARDRARGEPPARGARPRALRARDRPGRRRARTRGGPGSGGRPRRRRCSTTSRSPRPAHALHVVNAPSPAATASLAIAELVADRLERLGA